MDDFEIELRKTFFEEARQLLEEAEAAVMALDEGNHSPEHINKLFRLAHNFKGSARSVGLGHLSQFAHKVEDVLSRIKAGRLIPTVQTGTLLLMCVDALKSLTQGLSGNPDFTLNTSHIETAIEACLNSDPAASPVVTSKATPPPPAEQGFTLFDEETVPASVSSGTPATIAATVPATPNPMPQRTPQEKMREDDVIRVPTKRLDCLVDLVGEMVVNQSILSAYRQGQCTDAAHALAVMGYMAKLVSEVQDLTMSLRLVPVRPLYQKLKRTVRDIATQMGKDVEVIATGEHVELDKTVLERITDPLTHMIRNAIDHGVESRSDRQLTGKAKLAQVAIETYEKDDQIVIKISDDGRGLDRDKILQKGLERGLIQDRAGLSDADVFALIFHAGFSTKDQVTDISGRGVGMEVVQKAIVDLKGTVEISSTLGQGTTFTISLPSSLAIINGLVVTVDSRAYVIPITQLVETVQYSKVRIETSTGKGKMMNLRGDVIPIYSLSSILRVAGKPRSRSADSAASLACAIGIITVYRGQKVAFGVDEILGQQHVVLKKLGAELKGLPGVLGGAVLSNGEPGLVLNLQEFVAKGVLNAA